MLRQRVTSKGGTTYAAITRMESAGIKPAFIAALAGSPRAHRAVGNVMRACRDPRTPCHRVIGAAGDLTGYAGGLHRKAALLRFRQKAGLLRVDSTVQWIAQQVEARTGHEARTTVLGHIQRGGSPTAFDRVLATRFGLNAISAVKDEAWGTMVALQGTDIVRVPLQVATGTLKTVPIARYEEAMSFFG